MLLQKIEVYAQVAIFMGHQSSKNKAIFDGFYCEKAHSQHCTVVMGALKMILTFLALIGAYVMRI